MKLPPFGKYLENIKEIACINSIYLFIGPNSFTKAKDWFNQRPGTICLPPYDCPSLYRWPVKDCDILIIDTGFCESDYLNDIAYFLYLYGAVKVRCLLSDNKLLIFDN